MQFIESLKAFWTLISTPGTELPMSTTIIVLVIIVACTFLLPQFAQWRAYRRQNGMPDPKEAAKAKANAITGTSKPSQKKKSNNKKKKKR